MQSAVLPSFDNSTGFIASSTGLLSLALFLRYIYRRFTSPMAHAPIASADNFWTSYLGLVPPPSDTEEIDHLSRMLIQIGQDPRQSPVSVCWSVTGTPLVFVNTLKGIKDVLVDGQTKPKAKGATPNVQRGDLIRKIQNLVFGGKSINNTVGEEWRWRRHILLPPFQPRQLVPNLLPYVAKRAGQLMLTFQKSAHQRTAIELDEVFMDMTMDVINYYLYGRSDLNYDMVGGRSNLKNEHHHLGLGFQSPLAWLPFGLNETKWAQRSYRKSRELLKEFIRDSLAKALEKQQEDSEQDTRRTFHSVAAAAVASGRYDADREDLVNDLLSLTFAGYDTTAHTLAFCMSELARHPELQASLFEQVRQVLGPPPVEPSSITAEKLAKMPLVTAVYRETLRKYPAVALIPAHVNHDTVVDGVMVPAGAEIWCNVRGLQMNPAMFPDPNKFDPTRWLRPDDLDKENSFDNLTHDSHTNQAAVTPDQQYNFPDLSFTLGNHACLGKNLAILELRTVIACTVNQFTLSLQKGNVIDTKIVLTTKPRHGVWVHLTERE
ncbi:cytochrome P450 [Radiomyces spectabilis]|uniref:cytochrome P450 n=1 Tax=Radiomyces spectabilis TaxID=64574 RepID=UPI00221FDD21|nr:cytochrome P450 [Radiomyces spectabilis]KAI8390856.1 cytochrome P450 [Radiomyces spectabilis]